MKIVLPIITAFILSVIATFITNILVSSDSTNYSAAIATFFAVLIGILIHTIILSPNTKKKPKPAAQKQTKKVKKPSQTQPTDESIPSGPREEGEVKWFNSAKGYGFIIRDSGEEIFVHYRSIRGEGRRSLYDGQQVEFSVSEGEKGLQADDVEAL